jgi:hypothetical protein
MLYLYFVCYNFCRVHLTLHVTPAMEAGIADRGWEIEELVALLPYQRASHADFTKRRIEQKWMLHLMN